jgi:plasmid stabilization system protein ParE
LDASKPVRPNEAAEEEFRDYIVWYEKHGTGLGERLWNDIQTTIDRVAEHPAVGELVRRMRSRAESRTTGVTG